MYTYKIRNTKEYLAALKVHAKNKAAFQKSYWYLTYKNLENETIPSSNRLPI